MKIRRLQIDATQAMVSSVQNLQRRIDRVQCIERISLIAPCTSQTHHGLSLLFTFSCLLRPLKRLLVLGFGLVGLPLEQSIPPLVIRANTKWQSADGRPDEVSFGNVGQAFGRLTERSLDLRAIQQQVGLVASQLELVCNTDRRVNSPQCKCKLVFM